MQTIEKDDQTIRLRWLLTFIFRYLFVFFGAFVDVVINLRNWETGKFNMKTKENKLLSYIVYQTKGIQDNYLKIGTQNLDVDCFEIALRKIVKSALRGKPKKN